MRLGKNCSKLWIFFVLHCSDLIAMVQVVEEEALAEEEEEGFLVGVAYKEMPWEMV